VTFLFFVFISTAQMYFTKNGKINFDATSNGSPERVEGVNRTVTCVLDIKTGNLQFAVPMKSFEFEKALMQEHFNENYVESDKFPKAEFKGTLMNNSDVKYSADGVYSVKVNGKLTIHGISREVQTEGKLIVKGERINTEAAFKVLLADYNISIPGLVADKVSKTAVVSIVCSLEPFKG
jgi:polyisoprenoid-binding protein YceI